MGRMSSEYFRSENKAARPATFEETYPRYEFAEMVRIGLVLAEWLVEVRRRIRRRRPDTSGRLSPGEMKPAE